MGLVKKGVYCIILLGAIITCALQIMCIITTYGTFDPYSLACPGSGLQAKPEHHSWGCTTEIGCGGFDVMHDISCVTVSGLRIYSNIFQKFM